MTVDPSRGNGRVAGQGEDLPEEDRVAEVVLVAPPHDVAVDVGGAGVGGVHARVRADAATVVVREGDVHLLLVVDDVDPLRPVHLRGADGVGCRPGVDHDVGQAGEAGERGVVGGERQPVAGAVGVEPGDVEGAVVERVTSPAEGLLPGLVGDEAVDVLEALVVAHVHHDVAVVGLLDPRSFVLQPAQRGALHRRRLRLERVDLGRPSRTGWPRWARRRGRSGCRWCTSGTGWSRRSRSAPPAGRWCVLRKYPLKFSSHAR